MTERVDFYVLQSAAAKQRWMIACRLTEKAYLRNLKVVIVSDTAADAKGLDDLLWTFNERSFIPHAIHSNQTDDSDVCVHLTFDPGQVPVADLLVNLAPRIPLHLEKFARVAEIIDADEDCRRLGRERFKVYRDLKLSMETHQLDAAGDV